MRGHKPTGQPVGRPPSVQKALDQIRADLDDFTRERLSKCSEEVQRYYFHTLFLYLDSSIRAYELQQAQSTGSASTLQQIVNNTARVYKSLPKTPLKTAFLHEIVRDVPVKEAARALEVHHSTVSRASEYHDRPYVEFCRQLGFPRRNRADAHTFLLAWLDNDAHCPVPSGWNRRCYTGSPELMWAEYAAASLAASVAPLQFDAFHRERRRERVGIRSGDIFINRDEVELAEIRAKIEKGDARAEEWQERIDALEQKLAFCKERKAYYRQSHQDLDGDAKKMVVTLDFTATQTGMDDKFHDFVVVVCTDEPLRLPMNLTESVIEPEKPPMRKYVEKPVLEKKVRRKKEEVQHDGGGRNLLPSFNQARAKEKREPKLEQHVAVGRNYKPCSTVFHFVLRRTDDTPGQTSPYVQWAMDYLFVMHDLGKDFEEIHLFSDGCGKHFKTYPTHWYDSLIVFLFIFYSLGILPTFNNASCTSDPAMTAITTTIITTARAIGRAANRS